MQGAVGNKYCVPVFLFAVWAAELTGEPLGWLGGAIDQRGLVLGLVAVFVGGLALNLTPCVYPLVPVTLAFFGGQAEGRTGRVMQLAGCYVLGLSLSYATLGLIAAKSGALLGSWLQRPAVLIGVAAVIVGLALSMFGLYDLRVPQPLARRFSRASGGLAGAALMGSAVGVIAAPCIGPFVLGLFLFVSRMADLATGFLIFFTLGLGMGAPYLLLGLAVHRARRLPRAGEWLAWIKKLLGVVLIGLALYVVRPLVPEAGMRVAVVSLLAGSGVYLGWLERTRGRGTAFRWLRRLAGAALLGVALVVVWPQPEPVGAVAWAAYAERAFDEARRAQRPVVIDVYADWCVPCVELDHVTFRHPEVVDALADMTTLRLDATESISDDGQRLIDRYAIYGVPTVLLVDQAGTEHRALRVTGFVGPKEFLRRLEAIR